MNFADNWTRVFVVITFLGFGEARIIGGIAPNLIAFCVFIGAIGYFAFTGKMAEMLGMKKSLNQSNLQVIDLQRIGLMPAISSLIG